MVGGAFSKWWIQMKPYAKAYQEVWVGVAITALVYYKISFGGKKAVKGKPSE